MKSKRESKNGNSYLLLVFEILKTDSCLFLNSQVWNQNNYLGCKHHDINSCEFTTISLFVSIVWFSVAFSLVV